MTSFELFDTHCHLDLPPLDAQLPALLSRAAVAGVSRFLVPGVAPEGWPGIAALAKRHPAVIPAFGVHPLLAERCTEQALAELSCLTGRGAAIGEIGLDYTVGEPGRERQRRAFREQLRLAVAAGKPVLIHCRKAFQDLLRILREEGVERVGGVMHAFSGSAETARECIRLGLFISVSGTVTYRNAVRPPELVRRIPLTHLVVETDAPDMPPEPYRGGVNEPAFLLQTVRRVAELQGVPLAIVAAATTRNAAAMLRLGTLRGDEHE